MTPDKPESGDQLRGRKLDSTASQADVTALYEDAPYPGLGAGLKDPAPQLTPLLARLGRRRDLAYLEAGCGTGHFLVGVARAHPDWACSGIDLSGPSLAVAADLAEKHGARVDLKRQSYLDPLPWAADHFDIISAQGTIHHADDPVRALSNLARYLKADGLISMHLYGRRLDQGKFDLKEAISLFEPNLSAHQARFAVYRALVEHDRARKRVKRWLDTSPLDLIRLTRKTLRNLARRGRRTVWSPPWTDDYESPNAPWKDHFCHPCERAYEVPEVVALAEGAGLRIVHMAAQGQVDPALVPPALKQRFAALPEADQWRLMELLGPTRSFSLILART